MTNKEKLEALKSFLKENGIEYFENHKSSFGVMIDLKLPKQNIAVFVSNGKDYEEKCYNAEHHGCKIYWTYKPFFIRESESVEFVLEKMQNCIVERMQHFQRQFEKKCKKAAAKVVEQPKRKRTRISTVRYEKV